MLSNVSGFTQSSGEGPLPTAPNGYPWVSETNRKDSSGSASVSGSGSGSAGSIGDPKSPIGNGKSVLKWPTTVWDER